MKIFSPVFFLLMLFASQPLLAHGGHDHGPISELDAKRFALKVAKDLSSRDAGLGFGQLAKSWALVPAKDAAIAKQSEDYYIVSVYNKSEKKTLYILMSNKGDLYDANFTGSFEKLKKKNKE